MEKEKQMREQTENQLAGDMSLFFETTGIPVCCFQDKNLIRKISHPVQDFNLPLRIPDGRFFMQGSKIPGISRKFHS